jgi:hypothetical protein
MDRDEKAVTAGDSHGSSTHSAGVEYCPLEDRENQRTVILAHLKRHGSLSTAEARRWYFIMSPASRIFELRRRRHAILTERDPNQKCARYHLTDQGGADHA